MGDSFLYLCPPSVLLWEQQAMRRAQGRARDGGRALSHTSPMRIVFKFCVCLKDGYFVLLAPCPWVGLDQLRDSVVFCIFFVPL